MRAPASVRKCAQKCAQTGSDDHLRHPTPTNLPMKNGPEIIDFRPVLEVLAALANCRLRPLGHLTVHRQVYVTQSFARKYSMTKRTRRLALKPSPLPVSATTRVFCIVGVFPRFGHTRSGTILGTVASGVGEGSRGDKRKATDCVAAAFDKGTQAHSQGRSRLPRWSRSRSAANKGSSAHEPRKGDACTS